MRGAIICLVFACACLSLATSDTQLTSSNGKPIQTHSEIPSSKINTKPLVLPDDVRVISPYQTGAVDLVAVENEIISQNRQPIPWWAKAFGALLIGVLAMISVRYWLESNTPNPKMMSSQ